MYNVLSKIVDETVGLKDFQTKAKVAIVTLQEFSTGF